jgi:hypothetical protein
MADRGICSNGRNITVDNPSPPYSCTDTPTDGSALSSPAELDLDMDLLDPTSVSHSRSFDPYVYHQHSDPVYAPDYFRLACDDQGGSAPDDASVWFRNEGGWPL